jgi:hypothetical protein
MPRGIGKELGFRKEGIIIMTRRNTTEESKPGLICVGGRGR